MERRGVLEVLPEAVRRLWNKCQLRSLIVFSLLLQVALVLLGKVRKRNGRPLLRFIVWSAYLLADWVATVALGVISNHLQSEPNKTASLRYDLMSFWAPFLLLHLGGPDTITAYSLEDNQLWQRRLLELTTQTAIAVYIFLIAWPGISWLSILTLPMLLVGLIKFGERIYSLRSASTEQFRLSLMTDPDPGPNYSKFMEEFTLKKAEGFYVRADEVNEAPPNPDSNQDDNEELVLKAYDLFQTFKRLFVDLILSFQDRDVSKTYFQRLDPGKAFNVIEIELGFAYDVFYTKAPVIFTPTGFVLRVITFLATLSSLMVFTFKFRRDHYPTIDLAITYSLLVVAIILEVCGHLIVIFSDWADYWLKKHHRKSYLLWAPKKRWSNLIAQYSILEFCRGEKGSFFPRFQKILMADVVLEKFRYITYREVSPNLKELIFKYFLDISQSGDNHDDYSVLCRSRGMRVLEKYDCCDLRWSITGVEFDQSILLWHIATELCYYSDCGEANSDTVQSSECTESKYMSDYMLYLLVVCPFMLPIGIGMMRFLDTCAEAHEFFKERGEIPDKAKACMMLLRVNTEIPPAKVKGDRSKSVLFDACRVAAELRAQGPTRKWEIINRVWVEILAYAACHCRGTHHAQQLRKGGEFLTHVWLLMAHLGITEQFQIWQGHARAKFSAK